jgi:TonB-dependent receptor
MVDLPLIRDRLRFVGGVRVESSLIRLNTFDEAGLPFEVLKENLDPLPSANLIYSPRSDMNVRGSFSQTVIRPEFRELSPTQYPQPRGLRPFIGNPDLVQTDITSWDLRWEWFFSPLELLSLGFFYKNLDSPIEVVTLAGASNIIDSVANAETGKVVGFEFEGRKSFGFAWSKLRDLSLLTNVTYNHTDVMVGRSSVFEVQTNLERELQGASPFIVNAVLEYANPRWATARLLYNTAGRRILTVGSFGLPDIFEERRNQLDAVLLVPLQEYGLRAPITMKLSAENLLNDRYLATQGSQVQRQFDTGITVGLGFTYSF